jgi:transketolase
MDTKKVRGLQLQAAKIRKNALAAVEAANSGHIGGSFSIAEILSVLYFDRLRIDPKAPKKPDRDRFILSKGHCTPALYAALALRGFFPLEDLKTFRHIDSYLSGHVDMKHVPGVDMSAGSLGQGLSAALGMALAARIDEMDYNIYAVTGDGEIQEGQIWEASMAAAHFKADNLRLFVDNNQIQLDGAVNEIMSVYPIENKFIAFGWHVISINGHDITEIIAALDEADIIKGKPTAIISHAVKGRGVSIFENNVKFHGGRPSREEYALAYAELDNQITQLER